MVLGLYKKGVSGGVIDESFQAILEYLFTFHSFQWQEVLRR